MRNSSSSTNTEVIQAKGQRNADLKRKNKRSLLFNNKELAAINHYCNRYKIRNRSKFMRETIITEILRKFDQDYPSLFTDQPNLFSQTPSQS